MPLQVDPDRDVERLVADLTVANLDVDRVDEVRRIDRQQWPRGPALHLLEVLFGDPRDGVLADARGAVHLRKVRADLADGQALGVRLFATASTSFRRRWRFLTITGANVPAPSSGTSIVTFPGRVGQDRLGARAVMDVLRTTLGRPVLGVSEMVSHLFFHKTNATYLNKTKMVTRTKRAS